MSYIKQRANKDESQDGLICFDKNKEQKKISDKFNGSQSVRPSKWSESTVSMHTLEFPENGITPIPCFRIPKRDFKPSPADGKSLRNIHGQQRLQYTSSSSSKYDTVLTCPDLRSDKRCGKSSQGLIPTSKKSCKYSPPPYTSHIVKPLKSERNTSEKLVDSQHPISLKAKSLHGPIWQAPCKASDAVGAVKPRIGICRRPQLQQVAARTDIKDQQKFSLTEDPRKKFCLVNPQTLRQKVVPQCKQFADISNLVKMAENASTPSASLSSLSTVCEVIDLENPMQLDFHGLDYKNTYHKDEQDFLNQHEFRRVCRYKQRRDVKAETEIAVEREQQAYRIRVPECFDVDVDKKEGVDAIITEFGKPQESVKHFGQLFRSNEKPAVRDRIAKEEANRRDRYKQLYIKRKEKHARMEAENKTKKNADLEAKAADLAQTDFRAALEVLDRSIRKTERSLQRGILQRRFFPHTLTETKRFCQKLKKSKREIRERAKVREKFYAERLGKEIKHPEATLEISTDSATRSSHSEQSTDDEDAIHVGKRESRILLRGFHFKLDSKLRGKRHQKDNRASGQRKLKGCITRTEWFDELAPKKTRQPANLQSTGIKKVLHPDDPQLELFPPEFGLKIKAKETPIGEFRRKPLGHHYDRVIRKNFRIRKPHRHLKVKKFNLIGFLYGENDAQTGVNDDPAHLAAQPGATLDYMYSRAKRADAIRRLRRRRRMHFLGIPCPPKRPAPRKNKGKNICVASDSEDSDWIPSEGGTLDDGQRVSLSRRGNMPAPKYRESTLRRNPRKPRNYDRLRVPSEDFDAVVRHGEVPYMCKLPAEKKLRENVRQVKRSEYAEKFEARRHHDHWNPTQHMNIDVRYATKTVLAKRDAVQTDRIQKRKTNLALFNRAYPRGEDWEDIDLTLPKLDVDALIADFTGQSQGLSGGVLKKGKGKVDKKPNNNLTDFVFHSRTDEERTKGFPGRQEYIDFLHEIKQPIKVVCLKDDGDVGRNIIDKEAYQRELEEDLQSIASCLTSLSSSKCTNLTNDSGSFLLVEEKTKVPLDYIRKSLVPFEELNRCRFEAVPIDATLEEVNPYKVLLFAGQKKEQTAMAAPKDSFFTRTTRLQNGLRLRLEVKPVDLHKVKLGGGAVKAPAAVATDFDELYVADLRARPPAKPFKWNSCRTVIKDALRKKFESMLIQGQLVQMKIYDRMNEQHWDEMNRARVLFDNLFAKWEKREYDAAMEVLHKVKPYYERTDQLKQLCRDVEKEYTVLNMEIVYIENEWIRRTILQNFHYLLMEVKWRQEYDWIHKVDGELEPFEESIAKRMTTNIRKRDRDDAWAIREFYEQHYLRLNHPIIVVFSTVDDFLQGVGNLRANTFVALLELHFTLWILAELHRRFEIFQNWYVEDLQTKQMYAASKYDKKYFMEARANGLQNRTYTLLEEPVERSFNDVKFTRAMGICNEVWRQVVPANVRGTSEHKMPAIEQIAMISDIVVDTIGKFETIDLKKRLVKEAAYRRKLDYQRKHSKDAVKIEHRIEKEMNLVRRNLAPPYQKPKREGKLPRSILEQKIRTPPKFDTRISGRSKFFFEAFHNEDSVDNLKVARESLNIMGTIQESIVPFYFDHFLRLNGYKPNYNFKTQVELRDGPEHQRLKKHELVPEVLGKLERWEAMRQKIMEDNINKHPEMYQNVQS